MIWDDISGAHASGGSGSTSAPVFRQCRRRAESADGRSYEYSLETTDGKTAVFSIDGQAYELSQGALFLITTAGAEIQIEQLDAHPSALIVPVVTLE